jgi:hypothetical protein
MTPDRGPDRSALTARATHWALGLVLLLLLNVIAFAAFERWRPAHLSYDGLWETRTGFLSTLLLFDNLLAVWWYSVMTREQLNVAKQQADLENEARRQQHQPVVVTRRDRTSGKYFLRNVGAGLALNVYGVWPDQKGDYSTLRFGSLGAGAERPLAGFEEIIVLPKLGHGGGPHLVIAEGVHTRTN